MQLSQLRYFQCLAKLENYHSAAQELYISQPSLHNSIHKLEDELGTKLFIKNGRNIALTDDGKHFLKYVNESLEILNKGIHEINIKNNNVNEISIGAIMPAYSPLVSPILKKFQKEKYSDVVYHTYIYPSEILVEKLLKNEFDIIFCTKVNNIKNVDFISVYSVPYQVVVSLDDPLSKKDSIIPNDLNHRDLLFSTPGAYADTIHHMLDSFGIYTNKTGYANEEIALLDMVANGQGIFITTDYPQMHGSRTKLIPFQQEKYMREFYIGYRNDITLNPLIKDFIQYIINP